MELRYRVGDKVRVRNDLEAYKIYGLYFNEDMAKLIGKEVTIDYVSSFGYRIKEDGEQWLWKDEMFEDFKYNYKKGTKLRRIDDEFSGIKKGEIITLNYDIRTNNGETGIYETSDYKGKYFGDIIHYEEVKEDIRDAVMRSIYNSKLKYEYKILPFVSNPLCRPISYIEAEGGNQMTDIETLKTFNPKNLSEGKRQAEEEKANYEASEAKKYYTALINQKEELERIIKTTNEELKKVKESLAVFK